MTRSRARLRGALVVVQVMFALVLLVCAGLTILGFKRLANVYAGFQPETIAELEPVLPANSYTEATKRANFYQQLLRETAAMPGVTAAALVGKCERKAGWRDWRRREPARIRRRLAEAKRAEA
jgi:hypothetical protein